ncbi:hypothetical protein [Gorillibacterium timonense]|uniref:hypothetical protein n=1 Tax=Gorillibacterium timonense TaxID=1689269 RepID=UPI00071D5359|nr:hypothetical protein [Gorillibacterium timonense]
MSKENGKSGFENSGCKDSHEGARESEAANEARNQSGMSEPATAEQVTIDPAQEQFLRGVYLKAYMLEYDRREDERVRQNRKRLRRQSLGRLSIMVFGLLFGYVFLRMNSYDLITLLAFSLGIVALGTILEQTELRWTGEQEDSAGREKEWEPWK